MTFKFLCPQHRQWLYLNPKIACCEQMKNYDTAEYYRDMQQLSEAVKFAGCAYESAEIVLTIHAKDIVPAVLSFTASAILLADSLLKSNQQSLAKQVFEQAKARLEGEKVLHFGNEHGLICIKACISSLTDGVRFQDLISVTQDEHGSGRVKAKNTALLNIH